MDDERLGKGPNESVLPMAMGIFFILFSFITVYLFLGRVFVTTRRTKSAGLTNSEEWAQRTQLGPPYVFFGVSHLQLCLLVFLGTNVTNDGQQG
jgi:hypothetical protein